MNMAAIHIYLTPELTKILREKYGGDKGRGGRLSANIERLLWKQLENEPKLLRVVK